MFEKFTEKAINVVSESQNQAKLMQHAYVQPEHLLLAIVMQAKGIPLRLFKNSNLTYEELKKNVEEKLKFEKSQKDISVPPFSTATKQVLKNTLDLAQKSGNSYILYEHLFISVISDKNSYISRILDKFSFDVYQSKELLTRIVQKKIKKLYHPEAEEKTPDDYEDIHPEAVFEAPEASNVFERAVAKLSASNYEILGTEQILSSILEDKDSELTQIIEQEGVNYNLFEQKLKEINSRQAEFEGKQIIFTTNEFIAMTLALDIAKELGESEVTPTHMLLGILKAKKGIAYNILKDLKVSEENLEKSVIKPLEKQMPEALTIMRLAKQETRRLGKSVVGTEMFLLGILGEATGIGAKVLTELEVTAKDARQVIENLIGYGDEYFDTEITFTERAKRVLKTAWMLAKKNNSPKIMSEHLLYALTTVQECLAMQTLESLGVDVVEIRQGIIKESNANM